MNIFLNFKYIKNNNIINVKNYFKLKKFQYLNYHGCIIGSGPSGLYLAQNLLKVKKIKKTK